ncbi:MAG: hypothetical protein ABSG50_14520 [Opitutaceae bacterium]
MPPSLPPDSGPRPPTDFAPVLATPEPLFLVGGQAVNLWALYYRERTIELAPFVSRDADVLGDRDTLTALGKLTGTKPQFFPLRPPSNEVGVVIAKDANGLPLLVEVLRYVHGVSDKELRDPVYTLAIGDGPVQVQVPGPIALLQAKIANVAGLQQTGRQDARHVLILARLLPSYLEDLQKAATEGRMEERKLIDFLERLVAVVKSDQGRKVFAQLQIVPHGLFAGLKTEKLPKLKAFLEKRLPRALR